jgi:multimeric flavodoxin WrbA
MLAAHAYLFVAPENLASMAGVMKAFFDRQYYPLLDRIQGRPAAVIVAAGSDGHGAVRQIERILTGWRLRHVAESLIVRVDAQTPAAILAPKHLSPTQLSPARDLGRALAAGLSMGIF